MRFSGPIRVLVIDDDKEDFFLLKELLLEVPQQKFIANWVSSFEEGKKALLSQEHDVCLLDYRLGSRTGLDFLREAMYEGCRIPIILLTGYGEQEIDLEAMQMGAADYLTKSQLSAHLLERSIRYSIHRLQTLDTLKEREETIRELLDSTFEGILVHNDEGTILTVNRSAGKILGYSSEEMLGKKLSRYFEEDTLKSALQESGISPVESVEGQGIRKDGQTVELEISTKHYRHRGASARLIAFRDVTSRKQFEAQIIMQERLASVGLLASSIAHEIGTPLGVIRGRAEYLLMQVKDNAEVKKSVDSIVSQIDRVSKLIRSLLNLARGDQVKATGRVNLESAVSEVIELMAHELRKNEIEVRNEISVSMPIIANADAGPLHQVLLNLFVNSVHAIGTARELGRCSGHYIQIRAIDEGSHWILGIADSGCGISEKDQKKLFTPFFTTKEIGVGTGLGLVTCFRIVESWGGSIQVTSEEGVGTEFQLSLPKTPSTKSP